MYLEEADRGGKRDDPLLETARNTVSKSKKSIRACRPTLDSSRHLVLLQMHTTDTEDELFKCLSCTTSLRKVTYDQIF